MQDSFSARFYSFWEPFTKQDQLILVLSVSLQIVLGLFFGHLYDMRIFMATGYLVGNGQNPYIAQDLSPVFSSQVFNASTSIGYFPLWPLVLGLIYRVVYTAIPNLLVYNLAIKIPVIVSNICLAYLVAGILKKLGTDAKVYRRAWIFLLFNPFLLYATSAWGQFDSLVALLALLSLVLLQAGNLGFSAVLLALAVSLKPTALPILPVAMVYMMGKSHRQAFYYLVGFFISALLFCLVPFVIFGWNPTPILQGWNAHFVVGGGMSFMTFLELLNDSYQLPGWWWLLGLAWLPALMVGVYALKSGIDGLVDLLKKSTALILVFFLTRAWLSEANIVLVLPLVLILTSIGELDSLALAAVWILPLVFTIFNASLPQLFFPSMPDAMTNLLRLAEEFRNIRLIARIVVVVPWLIAGWWIVISCYRRSPVLKV